MKSFVAITSALALAVSGCTSVDSATVGGNEVTATGGEAVAVLQATTLGFSAIFNLISIVQSDLDQTVNKVLVSEAKNMGATKIDIKTANTTPRHGIFAVLGSAFPALIPFILSFPITQATAIAIK
jgi:hypothetical protein